MDYRVNIKDVNLTNFNQQELGKLYIRKKKGGINGDSIEIATTNHPRLVEICALANEKLKRMFGISNSRSEFSFGESALHEIEHDSQLLKTICRETNYKDMKISSAASSSKINDYNPNKIDIRLLAASKNLSPYNNIKELIKDLNADKEQYLDKRDYRDSLLNVAIERQKIGVDVLKEIKDYNLGKIDVELLIQAINDLKENGQTANTRFSPMDVTLKAMQLNLGPKIGYKLPSKENIRASASKKLTTKINAGKKELLEEMQKYPDQLEKDIQRLGKINMGETPIYPYNPHEYENLGYNYISSKLLDYVWNENPHLQINADIVTEILYGIMQNWHAKLTDKQLTLFIDETIKEEWFPDSKSNTEEKSIAFEKCENDLPHILVVKFCQNKIYQRDNNGVSETKLCVSTVTFKYNLISGDVERDTTLRIGKKTLSSND